MAPPIDRLIFTALSVFTDEQERAAFLDHACRGDADLRRRVDELLAFEEQAATFFDFQPEMKSGTPAEEAGREGVLAQIGRYQLVAEIGTGGCGVVYYARQEEPVRRKVALKVIKLGMDTEAVIARFEQERQALAQMDHPNIAHVLDAGATASGRPYFVMELVEGEKITDFCDNNHYTIEQRLALFVQVCRAIQHAHQKGLIHRDIKPSNVLVHLQDEAPVPKIIDFGIAKATAGGNGVDATVTRLDQFIGTPDYISPEQAQGSSDVDTRTDIYSLGVLLYELLSGRTPFTFKQAKETTLDEVRRIIREEEPKPPSMALKAASPEERETIAANRATDFEHLASQLAGDLDWIATKAMAKERSRRYDSATGLAMEIERYLNSEPVLARPPSRFYRLGKLMRRNKLVFAAGGIAVFGLLAGFSISTVMFFRERAARQEQARLRENAERLRAKAELREDIAHAAVKIKYGDLAGADELLGKVPLQETPSSLEAAQAFGTVADWHMHAERFKEAAARYASMIRAITSVDSSDLPSVSVNLLSAAGAVTYAGDTRAYEETRRMAIARFGATTNGVVAEQTLKACILLPPDKQTLDSLAPLAAAVERAIEQKQGDIGNDFHFTAWACFAMALWNYRIGNFEKAQHWAERGLSFPRDNEARIASTLIVRAMIEQQSGQSTNARPDFAKGRDAVQKVFANKGWLTPTPPASWFEWLNAALLLKEAERVIGQ